jgi:lipopolysaccharide export LptBFGC system permease protein LptF
MKTEIKFKGIIQFVFFVLFLLLTAFCLVGAFYNPAHAIFSVMNGIMCCTIYKHW